MDKRLCVRNAARIFKQTQNKSCVCARVRVWSESRPRCGMLTATWCQRGITMRVSRIRAPTLSHWQLYNSRQLVDAATATTNIRTFWGRSQDTANDSCQSQRRVCVCVCVCVCVEGRAEERGERGKRGCAPQREIGLIRTKRNRKVRRDKKESRGYNLRSSAGFKPKSL